MIINDDNDDKEINSVIHSEEKLKATILAENGKLSTCERKIQKLTSSGVLRDEKALGNIDFFSTLSYSRYRISSEAEYQRIIDIYAEQIGWRVFTRCQEDLWTEKSQKKITQGKK